MRYREPIRSDYETEEDYEDAMAAYQDAVDAYVDWYEERRREQD